MDKPELIDMILLLQQRTAHAVGPYVPEAWMGLSLTIGQLKSLFYIDYEGSTNFKRLARALGAAPPNVTGIVDRLVEQGLVSREENPEDRRMLILKISAKGKALLAELRDTRTARMTSMLDQLSMDELSMLAQGLTALAKTAEGHMEKQNHGHSGS